VTGDGAQLAALVEEFFRGESEGEALQGRFLSFLERKARLHLTLFERVLDYVLGAYKFLLPFLLLRALGGGGGAERRAPPPEPAAEPAGPPASGGSSRAGSPTSVLGLEAPDGEGGKGLALGGPRPALGRGRGRGLGRRWGWGSRSGSRSRSESWEEE